MIKITETIPLSKIVEHTNCVSPTGLNLCKAVVDITEKTMVIWGALHADEEEMLLDDGSEQNNLWGINLYAELFNTDSFIEFDSMINLRPNLGNRTRSVEDPQIRAEIISIVNSLIHV